MKNRKNEAISDKMSRDEIANIVAGDFNANMKIYVDRLFNQSVKKLKNDDFNRKILAKIHVNGKSGQRYTMILHHMVLPDGSFVDSMAVFMFFVVHSEYDIIYYSVSLENDKEIWGVDPDELAINRYTDHVVRRYGERNGGRYFGEDGFARMVIENFNFEPFEYGDNRLMARISNGALVGKIIRGKNCFNTYYTEEMIMSHKSLRGLYESCDVSKNTVFYCIRYEIEDMLKRFDNGRLTPVQFLDIINKRIANIDEDFYKESGLSKEYLHSEIQRRIIGTDAVCATRSDRSPLHKARLQNLCVESCIPGLQKGMPSIQTITPYRDLQNR